MQNPLATHLIFLVMATAGPYSEVCEVHPSSNNDILGTVSTRLFSQCDRLTRTSFCLFETFSAFNWTWQITCSFRDTEFTGSP